jgi:ribulose kinase
VARYGGKISAEWQYAKALQLLAEDPDIYHRADRCIAAQPTGAHGPIALDWLNGNRSVLVDHHLSGVVAGLTLATRAPDIYRAHRVHRVRDQIDH